MTEQMNYRLQMTVSENIDKYRLQQDHCGAFLINIFKTIHKRIQVSVIDEKRLDEMYWLRYYAYTRVRELQRPWTQITFERLMRTAQQLIKYHVQKQVLD